MAREQSKNREQSQSREQSQAVEPRRGRRPSRLGQSPSFTPFGMMRRFFDDVDRMFEGFGTPTLERFRPWTTSAVFAPNVEVYERDGKLVISADLPGLNKDDVKVEISEDAVLIEGERKYEHEEKEEGVYRSERSYGKFQRQIPLPEGVKTDSATANFKNGVLEITMEAPNLVKTRRQLEIQGDEESEKAA